MLFSRFNTFRLLRPSLSLFRLEMKNLSKLSTDGLTLKDFLSKNNHESDEEEVIPNIIPYLNNKDIVNKGNVFFETYGCQMNVSDTELIWSVMKSAGYKRTEKAEDADVVFLVTCAIRENAEQKIWGRLSYYSGIKKKQKPHMRVGILGCMAERLKTKILEKEKLVDVVCGPDAYRDLPRLLGHVADTGHAGVNVMLSLDETYADITPVRLNEDNKTAFVSIMRGCDNMCSYCIVPFTRGKERSRPINSILDEIKKLSDEGVKEITLLGQNVNSYRDSTQQSFSSTDELSKGFKTIYRKKEGGLRFADLLHKVASVDPEIRIRFTSPHPKDFPDELLFVIKENNNVCKSIHLPAQSGSSRVLDKMRRGYTREAYLELVDRIREILPNVSLSSDFISGFCGETEEDHQDTLTLMEKVKYDMAFMFAYSMREKTHAHRNLQDDVPLEVKKRRLNEVISTYRETIKMKGSSLKGTNQLILIEGESQKKEGYLFGRTDCNKRVTIPDLPTLDSISNQTRKIQHGDYVEVLIQNTNEGISLAADPLRITNMTRFFQ